MLALVTGVSGFVGSAVARGLCKSGFAVRALVRPNSDRRNLAGLDIEVTTGDLADPGTLPAAVAGCNALFHVAADYRLWVPDPVRMEAVNVDGTLSLMSAAIEAGVERIVYTSSVATLGIAAGESANETTPVRYADMIGPYKQSKFKAEAAVREMIAKRGLPAVIVNPSTPVGPGDVKPTPTGQMIVEAAAGRMPFFVDTGLNIVHVDDVAHGHLLAFEKGKIGERYILGGENMDLAQILNEIAKLTAGKPPFGRIPHGVVMPVAFASEIWCRLFGGEPFATRDGVRMAKKRMFFSSEKARRELGYSPRPAVDALRDAVIWFRDNGYVAMAHSPTNKHRPLPHDRSAPTGHR